MTTSTHRLARLAFVSLFAAHAAVASEAVRLSLGKPVILDIDSQSMACRVGNLVQGHVTASANLQSAAGVGFIQPDGTVASCWKAQGADPQQVGLGHDYGTISAAPMVAIKIGQGDPREARVRVTFLVVQGTNQSLVTRTCRFPQGAASTAMLCTDLPPAPVQVVDSDPNDGAVSLTARVAGVLDQLPAGSLLLQVDAGKDDGDVVALAAKAYFDWWDGLWKCAVEQKDIDACATKCGKDASLISVSASTDIPSNNPYIEPGCDVTCDCNDGGSGSDFTWNDPPQVEGAF